ncbi:hypothetical protein LINGRAHAP2_LOCUS13108 [Linum grandiflorum]
MCDCIISSQFTIFRARELMGSNHFLLLRNLSPLIHPPNPANSRFSSVCAGSRASHGEMGPQFDELGFRKKGKHELEFQSALDQDLTNSRVVQLRGDETRKKKKKQNWEEDEDEEEAVERRIGGRVKSRRRELAKRSSLLAKQVISVRSALSLGFISQLWIDPANLVVVVVEVGDVVLVKDENVLDYELNIVGLETLVGYQAFTPSQRNIGKVRGFSFNINSGTVESLELDSFGISIIPSSLGLWDARPMDAYENEVEEYSDNETGLASPTKRMTKRSRSKKVEPDSREDEWELPMDYL